MKIADLFEELWELGWTGSAYRVRREMRLRSGVEAFLERDEPSVEAVLGTTRAHDDTLMGAWAGQVPFTAPEEMARLRSRIPEERLNELGERARAATRGQIRCFGRWIGDYGHPIDWHVNPVNGRRWDPTRHWSAILQEQGPLGDIKLTWEVGRFPHAYQFARAAAFELCPRPMLAQTLEQQIRSFVSNNPFACGIHWSSGQEIAFRIMALTFSVGAFARMGVALSSLPAFVARAVFVMAQHLESQLEFSQRAIYNNHLLSEAVGLLVGGWMLPPCDVTARWLRVGRETLDQQAERQIYRDGAYIQQSHNYHRVAMHDYLYAWCFQRAEGRPLPEPWMTAMERSLDFLRAHQNPNDGQLPNYGANDGALPVPLSTCDFADFRPTLQAISVLTRGERLYERGPWDEVAGWLVGPAALDDAPLRPPTRRSVAFRDTGYYVLRGHDTSSFSTLRCGSLRDRFSQIDMLHMDVWWRGQNVLVDPGSYLYNGADVWHSHFLRTESHNTVMVDGRDQMLHFRQFKVLYWTQAQLLHFDDQEDFAFVAGEHHGFRQHPGRCVHRRSVLFVKDHLWIVVDHVEGTGRHRVRLHWLGGTFPSTYDAAEGRMGLHTPEGPFTVTVLDTTGMPLSGDMVTGQESPPRGWLSRYYAERVPVPSLAVEREGPMPMTFVSVLAAGVPRVLVKDGQWSIETPAHACAFSLDDGLIVRS